MRKSRLKQNKECKICGGTGYLPLTEEDPAYILRQKRYGIYADAYHCEKRCACKVDEMFSLKVGPEIYMADKLKSSALHSCVDKDVFIDAYRSDFLPHLRYSLFQEGLSFFFRAVTDSHLRDVFVGTDPDFPSLASVAGSPDLLVIYLAVLSHSNKAMAGVILEVLKVRKYVGLPTWLVNPPDTPFSEGHLAWSSDLDYYMKQQNFEHKKIGTRKSASGKSENNKTVSSDSSINILDSL